MARIINIYRVIGRDEMGRIARRHRIAAGSINEAQRIAYDWQAQHDLGHPITYNLLDVHKSADETVIVDA